MRISSVLSSIAIASSVYAESTEVNNSNLRGAVQLLSNEVSASSNAIEANPGQTAKQEQTFQFFSEDEDQEMIEEDEDATNKEEEDSTATNEEEEKRLYNDDRRRNGRNGRNRNVDISSSSISFDDRNGNRRSLSRDDRRNRGKNRNFDTFSSSSRSNGRRNRNNRNDSFSDTFSSRSNGKKNAAQKRQDQRDRKRTFDNPDRSQSEEQRERERKYRQSRSRNNSCADPSDPDCGNRNYPRNREAKRSIRCDVTDRDCNYGRAYPRDEPNGRRRSEDRDCARKCANGSGNTENCIRKCGAGASRFAFE